MKTLIIFTILLFSTLSNSKEIVQIKRVNTQFVKDSSFNNVVATLKKEPNKEWTIYLSKSYKTLSVKQQDEIITHFMDIALQSN